MKKFNYLSFSIIWALLSPIMIIVLWGLSYGRTSGSGDACDSSYFLNDGVAFDILKRDSEFTDARAIFVLLLATMVIATTILAVFSIKSTSINNQKILMSILYALVIGMALLAFLVLGSASYNC